jgi:hypothetical protein
MWDWAIWGALVLAFLAGVAALVLVVLRAREAWLEFRGAGRTLAGRVEALAAKAEATADRLETSADIAELEKSLQRLRVSLAQLAVLRDALDETQDIFGRIAAFMPRK